MMAHGLHRYSLRAVPTRGEKVDGQIGMVDWEMRHGEPALPYPTME